MSDNAFGPIGLEALMTFFQSPCCYSLKEFRLHNNGLGPDGAKKLAYSFDKCFQNSGGKFALRVFVCGRNRLEYEGAKAISHSLKLMGSLEEIQMPQNGIRITSSASFAETEIPPQTTSSNNANISSLLQPLNFNQNNIKHSHGSLNIKHKENKQIMK